MSGHLLGPARMWRGGVYRAICACGLDVYGLTLPALWERHQRHLDATRAASQTNHPSRRNP